MDSLTTITSLAALAISAFALGWNVYRDVVLKPRLRVSVGIDSINQDDEWHGPFVAVRMVNLGPGQITIDSRVMAHRPLLKVIAWYTARLLHISVIGRPIAPAFNWPMEYAMIVPDYTNPYSVKLPKRLEVGEKAILLLPCKRGSFLAEDPTHMGVTDSFGRYHWASRESLECAKRRYVEKMKNGELE
jgi:hypothetical protein